MKRDTQKLPTRTHIVPVRMSDEEHAIASACASALGISLSRLMRSRAEALPPYPPAKIDLDAARELTRIGNNLNQMARTLHSGFGTRASELEAILLELREEVAALRGELREPRK